MSVSAYRTVARAAEAEVEAKRSRFLGRAVRVADEAAARAVVEETRRRHWDARHHCSAFVLGPEAAVQRSNDDGEPSGTAGAPMLEVVRGREVSDVVVVVTRWFGGVLLGAGGLVRAYADATRAALEAAGVVERRLLALVDVTVPHAAAGRLENDLRTRGVLVRGVDHAGKATLHLGVPEPELEHLLQTLAAATGGLARPHRVGRSWVDT